MKRAISKFMEIERKISLNETNDFSVRLIILSMLLVNLGWVIRDNREYGFPSINTIVATVIITAIHVTHMIAQVKIILEKSKK